MYIPCILNSSLSRPTNALYIYIYTLTPWCRVHLEKLTGLQLVKKFSVFHEAPKVHYRTHKRLAPVSILGQPNPVHIPTSHLLEIYSNIIHLSTPRSPQWFFPSGFPYTPPSPHPYAPHILYTYIYIYIYVCV